jgi:hypothetical protein
VTAVINWAPPSSLARSLSVCLSLHRARALFSLFSLVCGQRFFFGLRCLCAKYYRLLRFQRRSSSPPLLLQNKTLKKKFFAKYLLSRFSAVLFLSGSQYKIKNPFFFVRVRENPERERHTHTHTHARTHRERGRDRGGRLEWRIAVPWGM